MELIKVDIFSFGMIYYEIFLAGDKSKRKMKVKQLSDIIREGIAEYDQWTNSVIEKLGKMLVLYILLCA